MAKKTSTAKKPVSKASVKKDAKIVPAPRSKKSVGQKPVDMGRRRKLTRRTTRKLVKKENRSTKVPAAWIILARSLRHLWRYKKVFIGVLLIYGLLNILFVKGIAGNFQLGSVRDTLHDSFGDSVSAWSTSLTLFGLLIGSAGTSNSEAGGVYQVLFIVIFSLALIWALRQTYESPIKIRVRDTLYKGMYPFIQFILVLFVIVLQLLPMIVGTALYSVVQGGSLAAGNFEKFFWSLILAAAVGISIYLVSASIFALYIVTLEDMTPLRALKAARKLVKFRRWMIIRKVVFLPATVLLVAAIVLIPIIFVMPLLAEIVYLIGSIAMIAIVHSYMYTLYRELL